MRSAGGTGPGDFRFHRRNGRWPGGGEGGHFLPPRRFGTNKTIEFQKKDNTVLAHMNYSSME
jgi:hypothetical protein